MRQLTDSEQKIVEKGWLYHLGNRRPSAVDYDFYEAGFIAALDHSAERKAHSEASQIAALQAENARLWAVYQEVYAFLEAEGFLNMGSHPPTPYEKKVSELEDKLITLFNEKALGGGTMKVGELIKFLQNFDPNKPVGFVDHFGKFIPLEQWQLSLTRIIDWKPTKSAVVITPPDIGEEPD